MALDVGVCILPEFPWSQALPIWKEVEERGFSTSWTYDHLSWRSLRSGPWFGSIPLLSAVAASTSDLRLGQLVTSPNFRHPVTLAKELMTMDDLSGGRMEVGIGAGTDAEDAAVLGRPPWSRAERTARFEEFVGLLHRLLSEPEVTSQGKWYSADDARQIPGCVQSPRIPFTVAGVGPRALRLAARFGSSWVTYGPAGSISPENAADWVKEVADQNRRVTLACEESERDPATLKRMVLIPLGLSFPLSTERDWDELAGSLEEAGMTDAVVHWPRPDSQDMAGISQSILDHLSS